MQSEGVENGSNLLWINFVNLLGNEKKQVKFISNFLLPARHVWGKIKLNKNQFVLGCFPSKNAMKAFPYITKKVP